MLSSQEYGGFTDLHSYSPRQDKLLVSHAGAHNDDRFLALYIVDLEAFTVNKLNTPRFARPVAWVNNNELLILYSHHFGIEGIDRLGLFDLQSGKLVELLDEHESMFAGLDVQWASLSPDQQRVAFTVERDPYRHSNLWILSLSSYRQSN